MFCLLKKQRSNKESFKKQFKARKWHYLSVKKLSALLREITSKHDVDCYCIICLYSTRTKNKHKSLDNVCKNHHEMPGELNNILE